MRPCNYILLHQHNHFPIQIGNFTYSESKKMNMDASKAMIPRRIIVFLAISSRSSIILRFDVRFIEFPLFKKYHQVSNSVFPHTTVESAVIQHSFGSEPVVLFTVHPVIKLQTRIQKRTVRTP